MSPQQDKNQRGLTPYMSPMGAWAFALGTSIGWGSLVITSNTYLAKAGPLGSTLGMVIGAVIMLIISRNYHYMMNCFPDAGGVYAYTKEVFGYDYGFLTAWFLGLTYLAIFWANATSLPLFVRYFIGDVLEFGYMYSLFGYKVYLGEAVMMIAAILITAVLCTRFRRTAAAIMVGLVVFFSMGIVLCFGAAMFQIGGSGHSFKPAFVPDSRAIFQVIGIACISLWAFIGFENISHFSEEFTFPHKKVFRILVAAVVSTTILYVFVTLLSVTAYPPEYASWLEYIHDLGNLSGIKGLPAFYAAGHYLGTAGITILILSLLALIITSLIGNTVALSRLFYALARDGVIPVSFARVNKKDIPGRAFGLIAVISIFVPFIGRTAIGWIVDVTTIGATIIYAFVSACSFKTARLRKDQMEMWTGILGLILMILFGLILLLPNLFSGGTMEPETFFLFTVWAIAGFLYFRGLLKRDSTRRFGKSIIVWIGLLSLILYTSLVWMGQSTLDSTRKAMSNVQEYYSSKYPYAEDSYEEEAFIVSQMQALQRSNMRSMTIVVGMFSISLFTLLNIYSLMRKRAEESEYELGIVKNIANTDPLTGVKSKHAYVDNERRIDDRIREGEEEEFSVVVCDVNGLKHINDTLGHKAGDEYIRAAAHMICELFAHSPVFRIGGDEFVVILTGHDHEARHEIMESLYQRSVENIGTDNVVVSGGCSDYDPSVDQSVHAVFERADALMYENKKKLKSLGARVRE